MNIEKATEYLNEIIPYEGTEVGDTWASLIRLYESCDAYVSSEFKIALEKEIITQAETAEDQFVLEEKDEIISYTQNVKRLNRRS